MATFYSLFYQYISDSFISIDNTNINLYKNNIYKNFPYGNGINVLQL